MNYLPADLRAIISKKNALPLTHFYFEEGMGKLRTRFLKTPEYVTITAPPAADRIEAQRRMDTVETSPLTSQLPTPQTPVGAGFIPSAAPISPRPEGEGLGVRVSLPTPFAWIDIPGKGYSIAKYPTTNAQFAKFIDAGGYNERKWWTEAGWQQREKDKWTQPRYWTDATWNGAEQPVVGVSWYESVAFCLWLSDVTSEKIMLPTEDQWQYAAQGDDGREYPWGKKWDSSRCNNNVDKKRVGKTTPVRQYEGKGDSPFGVVDMVGNVWEWCLTDYETKTNDSNSDAKDRVLRGGSWNSTYTDGFRCDFHNWGNPSGRVSDGGFRISRS